VSGIGTMYRPGSGVWPAIHWAATSAVSNGPTRRSGAFFAGPQSTAYGIPHSGASVVAQPMPCAADDHHRGMRARPLVLTGYRVTTRSAVRRMSHFIAHGVVAAMRVIRADVVPGL